MLNGLQLQDRALKVSLAKSGINSGGGAGARAPQAQSYGAYPGSYGAAAAQPYGMMPSYGGYGAAPGRAPRGTEDPERVSRTVHLTGVDPSINELQLAQFFAGCGAVLAVRIGGDGAQPTKMAWMEFSSAQGAAACVSLHGCALGMYPLKIAPSRSAIQNNGLLRFAAQMAAAGLPAPLATPPPGGGGAAFAAAAPASAYAASAYAAYAPLVAPPAELACTVHVGGVDVGVSAQELRAFFEAAPGVGGDSGGIVKMQYGPPPTMAQPFAIVFLEFASPAAALAAQALSGAALRGGVLRVSPAKSVIVGPGVGMTVAAAAPAPAAAQVVAAPVEEAGAAAAAEGEKAAGEAGTDVAAAGEAAAEEPAAAAAAGGAKRAREEEEEEKAEEAGAAAADDAAKAAEPAAAAADADAAAADAAAGEVRAEGGDAGAPEKRTRRSR
jgi:hypothetical protein